MDNYNEKTFKEKIEILKRVVSSQHMNPIVLDYFPEDFYQLNEKHLMYLWHFLTDKDIAELYGVTTYTVKKQRHSFGVNPVSSTFDRLEQDLRDAINKLNGK